MLMKMADAILAARLGIRNSGERGTSHQPNSPKNGVAMRHKSGQHWA
jgi:hypothetical protein